MKIQIETIPHSDQRYPTVGDWWFEGDTIQIRVSELSNWKFEMLIAVHELVEVLLCKHSKIKQADVDDFDKKFEAARQPENDDEPGDDVDAPYRTQHCIATGIERILAAEFGVVWKEYEEELNSLP